LAAKRSYKAVRVEFYELAESESKPTISFSFAVKTI
jgi:hypothetical protein